jgi:hypothetical protein
MNDVIIFLYNWGFIFAYMTALIYINSSKLAKTIKPLLHAFAAGYFFKTGLNIWLQDSLGLDGFIDFVHKHWSDVNPVIGGLLTAFSLLGLYATIRALKGRFYVDDKCAGKYDL